MRITVSLCLPLAFQLTLAAQLIPSGQPIPVGPNTPVVFLNGYQIDCSGSSFSGTFGSADSVLQANQLVTLFFDNCSVPNKPSIEALAAAFGQFLSGPNTLMERLFCKSTWWPTAWAA